MTNEEMLKYVCSQIKKIRTEKHISQMEISLEANLSQSFLAKVEEGKKEPSAMTLIRIAKALNISPREFFPEAETENKRKIKEEIMELLKVL